MNTIGKRLAFIIEQKNLTIKQVADLMETRSNNICRYVNDIRIPSNEFLQQFAKKLDINIDWLLFGTNYANTKVVYDQLPYKSEFIQFLKTYQKENIEFLQGKTQYKEPMIMKSFRIGVLKTSRKTMKRLMVQGYQELGLTI